MKKYNFIDDNYKIDFPVPVALQDLIDEAEKADAENDFGKYASYADPMFTVAKNCYAAGKITRKQWAIIDSRYCL